MFGIKSDDEYDMIPGKALAPPSDCARMRKNMATPKIRTPIGPKMSSMHTTVKKVPLLYSQKASTNMLIADL